MRTLFHHQPQAQHPKSFSYPQERRPITPSFGGKVDIQCSDRVFPLLTQSGHQRHVLKNAELAKQALRAALPPIAKRARVGVGRGVRGNFAVKLGEQRDAVGEAKLGACGGRCRVLSRGGAVDDEARARKRLEHGYERRASQRRFVATCGFAATDARPIPAAPMR